MRKTKPKIEELRAVIDDPVRFGRLCWPTYKIYDKQAEVLYSLRDNIETFVHAANEVGKDFITSWAVVWFFASRHPARVITSSSSQDQLKAVLWEEIRERVSSSVFEFPFRLKTLEMKRLGADGEELARSYVVGHVTKTIENFQGHHLIDDRPRVLGVFDEASGVEDRFNEAMDSWMHRKLVIGNPMNTQNFFYRCCKEGNLRPVEDSSHKGLVRKVIHIDADDTPNVQIGKALRAKGYKGELPTIIPGVISYERYLERQRKWDIVQQTTRLHGRFYEGMEQLLFPTDWLDRAEKLYAEHQGIQHRKAKAMGIDGAAGRDLTCWTIVDEYGVLYQYAIRTPDTMVIAGKTIDLVRQWGLSWDKVMFDAGGGGKQIADRLREQGYQCRTVSFGASAKPIRTPKTGKTKTDAAERLHVYKNKRAEMYGMLSLAMDPTLNPKGFSYMPDAYELRQELAILPRQYDSEGKLWLPPKDPPPNASEEAKQACLRHKLGRSPDRADGLVLAYYAMVSKTVLVVGAL